MIDNPFERKPPTSVELEARKAFKETGSAKLLTEAEKTQKAFHENRERLKAERLEREEATKSDQK